jgi:aryl-alcohol dehydrogenase-like predicted oxidoreductase
MNFGKRTPAEESERIVRRALERGVIAFDTANVYNDGESERILGRALGTDRKRVTLATKAGLGRVDGKPEGLSPAALERALAGSLARLGTDYVNCYFLHAPDHATPIVRTLDGMAALVASGRVRGWAISNYASWQILEMQGLADERNLTGPVASQVLYNVLHRQLEVEYFAFAERYLVHTSVYNTLAGGLLTGRHRPDRAPSKGSRFHDNARYQRRYYTQAMFDRVEALRAVAHDEGISLVQLAYAWVAGRPGVDSILVGPATVEQLDEALDAVERRIPSGALSRIDELWRGWMGTDTNYVR